MKSKDRLCTLCLESMDSGSMESLCTMCAKCTLDPAAMAKMKRANGRVLDPQTGSELSTCSCGRVVPVGRTTPCVTNPAHDIDWAHKDKEL